MMHWTELEFDKAFFDMTSKAHKIDQSQFLNTGYIPVIDQGQEFIAGFTNDNSLVWKRRLPVIIFGDHTRIVKFVDFNFVLGADGTKVLEINKEIFPLFAYYLLLNFKIPSAGYSRHFKFLKELVVRFPSYPEQQRIAAILQKADRLRQLRRYAHQLSDGYLQSVFLEMFGDPATNPKGYSLVKLGDLMSFMTSGSRGWAEHYCDKGALFLRVQNVGANRLLLNDVAFVNPPDSAESRRTRVKSGDLLISATADIGRTGVIPDGFPEAYINQHLFLIRLKQFNPIFVAGYFSTPNGKAQILQLDREGVKSGLNFDDAKGLTIFDVPLAKQEQFAVVYKHHEQLRNIQNESERQSEYLFQSLLQRAFQGEL
jgi:type I restriction enzyme S subunit